MLHPHEVSSVAAFRLPALLTTAAATNGWEKKYFGSCSLSGNLKPGGRGRGYTALQ